MKRLLGDDTQLLDVAFTWDPSAGPLTLDYVKQLVGYRTDGFKVDDVVFRGFRFTFNGGGQDPLVEIRWAGKQVADLPARMFENMTFRPTMNLGHPLEFVVRHGVVTQIMVLACVRLVRDGVEQV